MKLENGMDCLWQWNTQQRLIVDQASGNRFVFANTEGRGIVREALSEGGNTYVPIPNVLLQTPGTLYVYAHQIEENQLTTVLAAAYPIRAQPKPPDYIDDEQEVLIWYQLDERIKVLEQGGIGTPDAVRFAVQELSPEQQAQARKNIHAQEIGDYALKSEIRHVPIAFLPRAGSTPLENSQFLQQLIDACAAKGGGTIYIPAGNYRFGSNGKARNIDYCIRMKSNVAIIGDGTATVLLPTGTTPKGLDLFYFNDWAEKNQPNYLENCRFENFVIDGKETSCQEYTSAGKGFMFNLFRNCHWTNVTVKNTDGSGFGVDCPIDSTITNCVAAGCGKGWKSGTRFGASGIGIGYGYSDEECIVINNCICSSNANFGIFFEHQGRFKTATYSSYAPKGFMVSNCECQNNYINFGGIQAINVMYGNCISIKSQTHGFSFENSFNCSVNGCFSNNETGASYVVLASGADGGDKEVKDIAIQSCFSKYSDCGAKIVHLNASKAQMARISIQGCFFDSDKTHSIATSGAMSKLAMTGNVIFGAANDFRAAVTDGLDFGNSWNSAN